jgi:NTP pyrophosphatase (non-canonical NTP hydrolase)
MKNHSQLFLKENPTLSDIQKYVELMEKERGFNKTDSNVQKALHLGEEMGELFKAIRKAEKMRIDKNSHVTNISEELADILIFISAIANRYEIDLENAFREKEEINKGRSWS